MAAMFFTRADERSGRGWRRGGRARRRSTTPTRRGGGADTRPSTTSTGTRRRTLCGRITATFTKFLVVFSNIRFESGSGWMWTHSLLTQWTKKLNHHQLLVSLSSVHNIRRVPDTPRDPHPWLLRILIRGSIPNFLWIRNTYHPRTELSEKLSLSLHINTSILYVLYVYVLHVSFSWFYFFFTKVYTKVFSIPQISQILVSLYQERILFYLFSSI